MRVSAFFFGIFRFSRILSILIWALMDFSPRRIVAIAIDPGRCPGLCCGTLPVFCTHLCLSKTPKVSENKAMGRSFMAGPVVKSYAKIKTSARICARAREEIGGFHNGIQKNLLIGFPVPLDINWNVDGNPASGMYEHRHIPGAAHRANHIERFQRSGGRSMKTPKTD